MPSAHGARLLSLLFQFEQTQWWSADRLLQHQLRQLRGLLRHAVTTVPYYRDRLKGLDWPSGRDLTLDVFRQLPLLTRRDVQRAGAKLLSEKPPHPTVGETHTTGSTGEPVKVRRTQFDQLLWDAMTLRDHFWHQRDFSGKLAVIRGVGDSGKAQQGSVSGNWGLPASELFRTGPLAKLYSNVDVATQAAWLTRENPDYLLTYPSVVKALVQWYSAHGSRPPRLREVRTLGETVDTALRVSCRGVLGVPIVDGYSSQEFGYLGLQCPVSGQLHVMSENVLLEIIDDAGRECAPGEVGQVVATSLHNTAMPLIRYPLGDQAEAGDVCACGRGLPVIARVLGRIRNLLRRPDGTRVRLTLADQFANFGMVRQYQVIQRTLHELEVRLVVEAPLDAEWESRLRAALQRAMGYPFHLSLIYFSGELPRAPGNKFEEFVSRLPRDAGG